MAKLFPSKDDEDSRASKELVDAVVQMKQAGYTENEVIQALREQGYNPQEIQDALSQAEERGAEHYYPPPKPPSPEETYDSGGNFDDSDIKDKVSSFSRDINSIESWKEKATTKIDKLEQSVEDLKRQMNSLNKAIIGKVEDYEKNLLDVGTELKAMQKVFKDSLPELTSSISELSRISKEKRK
jgi:DNA-binding transcriptional MerR regulator